MKRIVLVVASTALAVWPVTADADRVTQGAVIQATDVVAGQRGIHVVHSVRRTNTLLPPALVRLELRFPPGTRVHPNRLPRCKLAVLQAKGPAACHARARVGSGSIIGRTVLYPEGVGSKVTIFNGQVIGSRPTVLMYVRPKLGPSFVSIGTLSGGRKARMLIDVQFPLIRPLAGPFSVEPSLSDFSLRFRNEAFLSAPCPGNYQITSHFMDGLTSPSLRSSDRARCN